MCITVMRRLVSAYAQIFGMPNYCLCSHQLASVEVKREAKPSSADDSLCHRSDPYSTSTLVPAVYRGLTTTG